MSKKEETFVEIIKDLSRRLETLERVAGVSPTGTGTTDHAVLSNLDYTSSGHTGFASQASLTAHIADTNNPHNVEIDDVTPATAKGDLIAQQASGAVRLPVGADDKVLTADSTQATGLAWKTPSGGGAVDSVNGNTGVVVLDQDDIADGTTNKQYSASDKSKLAGIEAGAEVNIGEEYTTAEQSKLAGIEDGAQVNVPTPMIILSKSSSVSQNVGGANGTEVIWTWDGEIKKDTGFTHDNSTNSSRVEVDEDGWYEVHFIGGAQTTGSARTTLQGIHKVNGGATSRGGSLRNYARGSGYGNMSPGLIYTLQLSAGDYIEVGTRVEDTDSSYTINTSGGEISDDCHYLRVRKIA